jgi:hypothetical protein
LNEKYTETRDHLEKAEEFIIQLQEANQFNSPVNTLAGPDTERTKLLEEELHQLQVRSNQFEHELAAERLEKHGLLSRTANFTAEYEDMEYRYKTALD